MRLTHIASTLLLLFAGLCLSAQTPEQDLILNTIQQEADRNLKELSIGTLERPFYIDTRITDCTVCNVQASYGSIVYSRMQPFRGGLRTMLVGSYDLNNLSYVSGFDFGWGGRSTSLALGNNPDVIRINLWQQYDNDFKNAVEQYQNKKTRMKDIPEELHSDVPDFEKRDPAVDLQPINKTTVDLKKIEKMAMEMSKEVAKFKEIDNSGVSFWSCHSSSYYYSTEGTKLSKGDDAVMVRIFMSAVAPDGEQLSLDHPFFFANYDEIPPIEMLREQCGKVAADFVELLNAPAVTDQYEGPLLYEGPVTADFVLANFFSDGNPKGLIARKKPIANAQMSNYANNHLGVSGNQYEKRMGRKITSRNITIQSLTGTPTYNNEPLFGHYPIDDQGVKPDKEMMLVEEGLLRNMINGRYPTTTVPTSNGHFRVNVNGDFGAVLPGVVKMTSKVTLPKDSLKQRLIEKARYEDCEWAYILRNSQDGLTMPRIYRVDLETGKEQLVRGLVSPINVNTNRFVASSDQEIVCRRMVRDVKMSVIVPDAFLLDETTVETNKNETSKKIPYIIEKPQALNP